MKHPVQYCQIDRRWKVNKQQEKRVSIEKSVM